MILIADSGSTKTSWVLAEKGKKVLDFETSGFNPYIQSKEFISNTIGEEISPRVKDLDIGSVYFYGAGCSTDSNKKIMFDSFKTCFTNSYIEIEHDLLAAARALWFDGDGIVAILGTGSNSCLYKGGKITDTVPSLGFILGDEGSGAYMGKILIRDYLYNKMPERIKKVFYEKYGLNTTAILDNIYKKENPNRWLSSFAFFISCHIHEDYCRGIAMKGLKDFFDAHLIQYPGYQNIPMGVVGSIGFFFMDCLEIVSHEYGFNMKKVIKSPIEELVRYHLNREKQ